MDISNGPHIIQCLQENMSILKKSFNANPESIALYNLSNALVGMYQDIEAEFQQLNTKLTNIERLIQR